MPPLSEKGLQFHFPNGWIASKFDDWEFYRCRFNAAKNKPRIQCSRCKTGIRCASCGREKVAGMKGVDFVAVSPSDDFWHIEVKDYRQTRVSDFAFLADEVALKVRDTLACLVAAQIRADNKEEKQLSAKCLQCKGIRVVLHLEQPDPRSRLESTRSRRANLLARLRQLVKAIDPQPLVLDRSDMNGVDWTVTLLGSPSQ